MTLPAVDSPAPDFGQWPLQKKPRRRWELRPVNEEFVQKLAAANYSTPLMRRIFAARGLSDPVAIEQFLQPAMSSLHDPYLFLDMEKAVDAIVAAASRGDAICVFGDYDVDGITATAILKTAFDFLKIPATTYIPHRMQEGYGLSAGAVRQLAANGVKLVITVDNGITAVDEIALARTLGVDVIVTDHHEPGHALPEALAIVNPKRKDCTYPFKDLCGAGVSFKLAHALLKRLAPDAAAAKDHLKKQFDLLALATVADSVALHGENRCFVSQGMKLLRSGARLSIKVLMETAGVNPQTLEAMNLAFAIAPRLNAAGRTEHAGHALDLLLTEDVAKARELSDLLERLNNDRRKIEGDITIEAMNLIREGAEWPVIVIGGEGWHQGVVGIVASRVLDMYHRPVVVLGVEGEWAKGSARSVPGFDMHAALDACSSHLEAYGGHTMAAGLRLRSTAIEAFRRDIVEHAKSVLRAEHLAPALKIDAEADIGDLSMENAQAIAALEPFGMGNSRPLLAIGGLTLVEEPRILKTRHAKFNFMTRDGRTLWAIGFSMADRVPELRPGMRDIRIAGTPFINNWNGQSRMEIELKDFEVGTAE